MSLQKKNRSHRYDISKVSNDIHGHKYTKQKMCLNTMMALCIKQHLSNT